MLFAILEDQPKAVSIKVMIEKHAEMILGYLRQNPEAGDTLEGIARWWLGQARIDISMKQVEEALEELVHQGVVKPEILKCGNILYKFCEGNNRGAS